jgi:hypothetical protein
MYAYPREAKISRIYFLPVLLVPLASQVISGGVTSAVAQRSQTIECVKRTATATPPPHPAGPRRAATRKDAEPKPSETAAKIRPACPEGEVPVIGQPTPASAGGGVLKGNPLLRPRSDTVLPQERLAPSRFRRFEDVYGKVRKPAGTKGGPPPGPPGSCDGIFQDNACYYYASAALQRSADGGGMTISVDHPAYVNSGSGGHSLDEIAIQAGTNNGNIIELGWLVSTDQNGDADPHIFVFHWVNGNLTCYNGCGWQQFSNTYYPSQNVSALLGRDVYIGYVFYEGNWWAWFDDQWLGYFPGSLWQNTFTKNALIQWFGEVASNNGIPPKTQMGDGTLPPPPAAAHMLTLCDVDAKAWVCWIRDQQSLAPPTVAKYYDIKRVGFGEARYGGPGQ